MELLVQVGRALDVLRNQVLLTTILPMLRPFPQLAQHRVFPSRQSPWFLRLWIHPTAATLVPTIQLPMHHINRSILRTTATTIWPPAPPTTSWRSSWPRARHWASCPPRLSTRPRRTRTATPPMIGWRFAEIRRRLHVSFVLGSLSRSLCHRSNVLRDHVHYNYHDIT